MTRSKKQLGKYSRRKGAAFEREGADMWATWTGLPCRRTPRSGAYGGEGWDNLAGDLMFSGDNTPNIIIEIKRREGWTWEGLLNGKGPVYDWWAKVREEAKQSKTPNTEPILMFKKNRGQIWVACQFLFNTGFLFDEIPDVSIRIPHVPITIFKAQAVSGWKL